MFCSKCGAKNEAGSKFCNSCGAPIETASPAANDTLGKAKESVGNLLDKLPLPKKVLKFVIPVVAVGLVLIILAIAGVFGGGNSPEKTLKDYANAMVNGDGEKIFALTVDPYYLSYQLEYEYYDSKNEMLKEYKSKARGSASDLRVEFGGKPKLKVEILDVEKYSKSDVKAVNKYLYDEYGDIYNSKNTLQDIRVIEANLILNGPDDYEEDVEEIVVYKIKGKWYLENLRGIYDTDDIEDAIYYYGD